MRTCHPHSKQGCQHRRNVWTTDALQGTGHPLPPAFPLLLVPDVSFLFVFSLTLLFIPFALIYSGHTAEHQEQFVTCVLAPLHKSRRGGSVDLLEGESLLHLKQRVF